MHSFRVFRVGQVVYETVFHLEGFVVLGVRKDFLENFVGSVCFSAKLLEVQAIFVARGWLPGKRCSVFLSRRQGNC